MERMKQTVLFCKSITHPGSISGDRHGDGGGEGNNCIKRGKNERGKPTTHRIIPLVARLSAAALDSRGERRDERPARSSWLFVALCCYCSLLSS